MSELWAPDAEREVLASLAFHGRAALVALPPVLRDAGSWSGDHRAIARVLLHLAGFDGGVHPAQVREAALALGELHVAEHPEAIAELVVESLGSLDALAGFAGIVADLAARRSVRAAAQALDTAASDRSVPLDTAVAAHLSGIITTPHTDRVAPTLVDVLYDLDEEAKRGGALPGLSTHLAGLDDLLDGLCPERLIVLAARPGCGKTAFALWVAHHVADGGSPVYFVTLEQPVKQIQRRRLALAANEDIRGALKRGTYDRIAAKVTRVAQECHGAPLHFDDAPQTATAISLAVQRHSATVAPVELVVVDYLSWIQFEGRHDRHDLAIGSVTKALAQLAKRQRVAVLLLVQIGRGVVADGRSRRPALSDLRDSGAIEQDADQVVLVWEPPTEGVSPDARINPMMEFVVAKNRHGPIGAVEVEWYKPTYRYSEPTRYTMRSAA